MTRFAFPALLADIGGTNARFCLKLSAEAPASPPIRLKTAGFDRFEAAAEAAIADAGFARPRSLLLGAAGPVSGRSVTLTNANWHIDGPTVAGTLGLEQGLLLNDFETLALAVPALTPGDWQAIGIDPPAEGLAVVIGPGTGLGVGAVVPVEGRMLPLSSEGGHIAVASHAGDGLSELLPVLGSGVRIPAETLLAGPGLMRLYDAVTVHRGHPALMISPEEIVNRALEGSDPIATETVRVWLDLLARFCGDMALTFMAKGGIFLAGGILPRLRSLIDPQRFRALFEAHPTHRLWLTGLPIRLITVAEPAFCGLAALSAAPDRHILDYGTRLWR